MTSKAHLKLTFFQPKRHCNRRYQYYHRKSIKSKNKNVGQWLHFFIRNMQNIYINSEVIKLYIKSCTLTKKKSVLVQVNVCNLFYSLNTDFFFRVVIFIIPVGYMQMFSIHQLKFSFSGQTNNSSNIFYGFCGNLQQKHKCFNQKLRLCSSSLF